jgi:hypothetical protein
MPDPIMPSARASPARTPTNRPPKPPPSSPSPPKDAPRAERRKPCPAPGPTPAPNAPRPPAHAHLLPRRPSASGEGAVALVSGGGLFAPAAGAPRARVRARRARVRAGGLRWGFGGLDAACVVVEDVLGEGAALSREQLRVFAMPFSGFPALLVSRPGSVPPVDPRAEMFRQEPYLTTGLVTWLHSGQRASRPRSTTSRAARLPAGPPTVVERGGARRRRQGAPPEDAAAGGLLQPLEARDYFPLPNQGTPGLDPDGSTLKAAAALAKTLGAADPGDDVARQAVGFVIETSCRHEDRLADTQGRVRSREHYRLVYG